MSATMLTQMTGGSPVVVVARLADVSEELVGIVYVFANGVEPDETPRGPLGFQPDVFDSAPGDPDYTPLRKIVPVTWGGNADAQVLKAEQEILDAEARGDLSLMDRGAIVVMPFLTWPGGSR
jgi:hypothetical protein